MIPVLKSFLKSVAFAFIALIASWAFGYPVVGIFIAGVAVMVGFLWVWDYVDIASKDCWMCGRTELNGRYMLLSEWYDARRAHENCDRCHERLIQPGDKLFGKAISRKAA